jgi:hypothetical protein
VLEPLLEPGLDGFELLLQEWHSLSTRHAVVLVISHQLVERSWTRRRLRICVSCCHRTIQNPSLRRSQDRSPYLDPYLLRTSCTSRGLEGVLRCNKTGSRRGTSKMALKNEHGRASQTLAGEGVDVQYSGLISLHVAFRWQVQITRTTESHYWHSGCRDIPWRFSLEVNRSSSGCILYINR